MKETSYDAIPYQNLDELGRGSYATVNRAIHKQTGEISAIKKISSPRTVSTDQISDISNLINEIKILNNRNDCKNIVRFLELYASKKEDFIVMEYCCGGSVKDAMRRLGRTMSVEQITVILRDVLNGLAFLHNTMRMIHRDVKGDNILLHEDGVAKLGDFGVSEPLDSKRKKESHLVGTLLWLPPEVINEDPNYGTAVDIWSLGITIIEMADGKPPYDRTDKREAMKEIANLDEPSPSFKDSSKWPQPLVDFVGLCLDKNASKRKSACDLLGCDLIVNAPSHPNDVVKRLVAEVCSSKLNQTETSLFKKFRFSLIETSILSGICEQHSKKVIKVDQMKDSHSAVERDFEHLHKGLVQRHEQINEAEKELKGAKQEVQQLEKDKKALESRLDEQRRRKRELLGNLTKIKDEIQKCNKLRSLESM